MAMLRLLMTLAVCLWTGAVLAIAFIAAPAAFAALPDRALAGSVAALMFRTEAYGSVGLAALAWLTLRPLTREAPLAQTWPLWVALLAVLMATVMGYFGLIGALEQAKVQYGSASAQYLRLHGISMALYAVRGLGWLALSALLLQRLRRSGAEITDASKA